MFQVQLQNFNEIQPNICHYSHYSTDWKTREPWFGSRWGLEILLFVTACTLVTWPPTVFFSGYRVFFPSGKKRSVRETDNLLSSRGWG